MPYAIKSRNVGSIMKKLFILLLVALIVFLLTPQSVRIMQKGISSHEKSAWAPVAQYQLGGFCFCTLKYSQAIRCYRIFINKYPRENSNKLAKAMFRTGVSYGRIKNYREATMAYERFAKTYPSSEFASRAKSQANKLRMLHSQ